MEGGERAELEGNRRSRTRLRLGKRTSPELEGGEEAEPD